MTMMTMKAVEERGKREWEKSSKAAIVPENRNIHDSFPNFFDI